MTITNVTPTGNTNEEPVTNQPIDNLGNPIDDKGNPVEVKAQGEGETLESLQKALKDTKAELTRLQQEKTSPKVEEPNNPEADAKGAVEEKGLDFSKYSNEINTNGELSEDSYTELASKGFPKAVVDDYILGQQARIEAQTREVASVVGGENNLAPVLSWAAENLTAEELNSYNASVALGTSAAKLALQGVYARYVAANGRAPALINSGTPSGASDVFKSNFEMTKAMQDPRYWNDPDYQKEVAEKAARSAKAGTI